MEKWFGFRGFVFIGFMDLDYTELFENRFSTKYINNNTLVSLSI